MSFLHERIKEVVKGRRYARRDWLEDGYIPQEIISELWELGIRLTDAYPVAGMDLGNFLDNLKRLHNSLPPYKNKKMNRDFIFFLYNDTIENEVMHSYKHKIRSKKRISLLQFYAK